MSVMEEIGLAWEKAAPKLEAALDVALGNLKTVGGEAYERGRDAAKDLADSVRLVATGELDADVAEAGRQRALERLELIADGCKEAAGREAIATARMWLKIAGDVGMAAARIGIAAALV